MSAPPPTSDSHRDPNPEPWYLRYQLVFRSYDQVGVAIVLVACIIGMAFYFAVRIQRVDSFIDIDRAPERPAQYLVDINSAEWPEIANLPGIGPKLANAIVEYRTEHGEFHEIGGLIDVSGIGPSKLRQFKEFLAPIESAVNE